MLYLVVAIPIPAEKAGTLYDIAAQAEHSVVPCLKAMARMQSKRKLNEIVVVSEAATVVMAEFPSRAEANKFMMSLSAAAPSERPDTAIPAPLYGPVPKQTPPQQQPLPSLRVVPVKHDQGRAEMP